MPLSYIVDSVSGCRISNYQNQCLILSTHVPIFGCGASEVRIWRAGIIENLKYGQTNQPIIISISEL
jgi:hypothetical protein